MSDPRNDSEALACAIAEVKDYLLGMVAASSWTLRLVLVREDFATMATDLERDVNLEIRRWEVHCSKPSFSTTLQTVFNQNFWGYLTQLYCISRYCQNIENIFISTWNANRFSSHIFYLLFIYFSLMFFLPPFLSTPGGQAILPLQSHAKLSIALKQENHWHCNFSIGILAPSWRTNCSFDLQDCDFLHCITLL